MKKYNIGTSIFLILVGLYVINYSKQFEPYVRGTPGPGFWPGMLGVMLVIISTLLLLVTIFSKQEFVAHLVDFKSKGFQQVLKLFLVMILFSVGLNYVGFLLSSLIFVALVMWIMGVRQPVKISITSVSITLSIYVIFAIALGLVLPRGKLF